MNELFGASPGNQSKPLNVAVLFGGRSVEHEISVISGLQLITAMDQERFKAIPIYIAPSGKWYTGDALLERKFYTKVPGNLAEMMEVSLLPKPGLGGLVRLTPTSIKERASGCIDLQDTIPVDVFLPAFHGQFGEDGGIQGLFELADVVYTGSPMTASAVSMNKHLCKTIAAANGIPVLPGRTIRRDDALKDIESICSSLLADQKLGGLPLFVKPGNLGSSIGVSRVLNSAELAPALVKVFRFDEEAIIEPCVTDIMEINVSVREANGFHTSVVEIPVSQSGVLSYEDKYLRGGGKKTGEPSTSQGMASLTRVIDPQDLAMETKNAVQGYAKTLFEALGCSGVARLDFIVDTKKQTLYFNEINPFPGSASFYLWVKTTPRVLYTDLISGMIDTAIHRKGAKDSLDRHIGLKALK